MTREEESVAFFEVTSEDKHSPISAPPFSLRKAFVSSLWRARVTWSSERSVKRTVTMKVAFKTL
jgi:hypothetical protein